MVTSSCEVTGVDLSTLVEALEKQGHKCETTEGKLLFRVDRYVMNPDGYYVGWEIYEGMLPLHKKKDFSLVCGAPWSVEPFFVFPSQLDSALIDAPDEEEPEEGEDAEDFCGYCHPDGDFVWNEVNSALAWALKDLPQWQFNPEVRQNGGSIEDSWELGWFNDRI